MFYLLTYLFTYLLVH